MVQVAELTIGVAPSRQAAIKGKFSSRAPEQRVAKYRLDGVRTGRTTP